MERFDIAIIGTGPAGLEAAITAKVRNKKVLLLGTALSSEKVTKAHLVQNYLGLPNATGEDLLKAYKSHLEAMEIEVTEDKVNAIYAMGDFFAIQGHKTDYEASTVILAAGMSAAKPFSGEMENLGRGVSYCATCDAALYKSKSAVIVAYGKEDEEEAIFLAERADKVYYLPQYNDYSNSLAENIDVIADVKPLEIIKNDCSMTLRTEESDYTADGIFILRQQVAPSQLVPGLAMDGNHVAVDRQLNTNIKGLFAAGDITGTPYQYIKAAGEGNVAALSAVSFIANNK